MQVACKDPPARRSRKDDIVIARSATAIGAAGLQKKAARIAARRIHYWLVFLPN